jgi:ribosomal protein L4
MKVSVYNKSGEETGRQVELNDAIFAIEPNDHAIYLDCKQYMANGRQGTHSSLHRGLVSGSTKKLKRQKAQELPAQVVTRAHYSRRRPCFRSRAKTLSH